MSSTKIPTSSSCPSVSPSASLSLWATSFSTLSDFEDSSPDDELQPVKKIRRTEPDKHELPNRRLITTSSKNLEIPLTPDSKGLRTWMDRSLQFQAIAELVGTRDDSATLHKANGYRITVPFRKLSVVDLEYIQRQTGLSLQNHIATSAAYQLQRQRRKQLTRSKPPGDLRLWTDVSGRYTQLAKYLGLENGKKVRMHKENGFKITVPLHKLSMVDVDFVRAENGGNFEVSEGPL